MAEIEEEKWKKISERDEWKKKTSLKPNIQKLKITTSNLITSWQIDGETMETMTDFIFLGSKSWQMMTVAMK